MRPLVLPVSWGTGRGQYREYQVIPKYGAAARAGAADQATSAQDMVADVAGVLAMDRAYMRDRLGRDGGGFLTIMVAGNSMLPTLEEGDAIIVDTLATRITDSAIYVVLVHEALLVKRFQRKADGSLMMLSDNKVYKPERLTGQAAKELKVIGRMVWPKVR